MTTGPMTAGAAPDARLRATETLADAVGLGVALVDNWHLIRHWNGREELHDVAADPLERGDLVGLPEFASVARALRGFLGPHRRRRCAPSNRERSCSR